MMSAQTAITPTKDVVILGGFLKFREMISVRWVFEESFERNGVE